MILVVVVDMVMIRSKGDQWYRCSRRRNGRCSCACCRRSQSRFVFVFFAMTLVIASVIIVSGMVAVVESVWEDDGALAGHYHCCYSYG